MTGEAIQIGPFVKGLNTFSDPTAVDDSEAVEMLNFELDLDGSLKSRPPFVDLGIPFPLGVTGNMSILGYYYAPGSVPYLIASDGLNSTYYFNGTNWVLITNTIAASAMTQFDSKAWLLAPTSSANPGGYWSPGTGFVADANMPKGEVIVAHKFRLWVAAGKTAVTNGTRLYYSKVLGTIPMWVAAPDFIDVGAGDGQNIVQCKVYYNSLLVFRTDSVYSFQYTSDPALGVVSLILPGIGLSDKDCVVDYESFLYFMYQNRAYEFVNNRASQLNIKVPFAAVSQAGMYKPFAVSVLNGRAIFSYYDTMFVFNFLTRTWTKWRSTARGPIGRIVALAGSSSTQGIAHSSASVALGGSRSAKTLRITDAISTDAEPMQCVLQTKNYNYEASSVYKKLAWWGADAVFRGQVTAIATPVVFNYNVTWGQLLAFNWGNLLDFSWGQPISGTLDVQTVRDTTGSGSMRKFVKFMKALRFRQINFKVTFDTDGSISTAPVRLFSLMTYVRAKERVSKAVT